MKKRRPVGQDGYPIHTLRLVRRKQTVEAFHQCVGDWADRLLE